MSVSSEFSQSLRLCQISKWEHFDGYGFNLHAEKGKHGQFIGKVDEKSPAEAAGLKEGDRIIEVNGANIANENHKQVVNRIKAVPDQTELLVVDTEGDAYFKTNNVELNSSLPFVVRLKTPVSNHSENSETESFEKSIDKRDSTDSSAINEKDLNNVKTQEEVITSKPPSEPSTVITEKAAQNNLEKASQNNLEKATQNNSEKMSQNNTLNLNMTARELRAQLAARKKYDPKKDNSLDVKKKYDIVQKL